MRSFRRCAALLGALLPLAAGLPAAASAAPLRIGDPVPAPEWIRPLAGSFKREPLLRPDPQGGPPWAIGSFRTTADGTTPSGLCVVVGGWHAGSVGRVDAHGVFHPFALGAGAYGCGGSAPGQDRGPLWGAGYAQAIEPDAPCYPYPDPPDFPGVPPACDQQNMRGLVFGIWGTGVIDGHARLGGSWQRIPVTRGGAYNVVQQGTAEGQVGTRVRFRFRNCGPLARPDLARLYGAVVSGCTITYEWSANDI